MHMCRRGRGSGEGGRGTPPSSTRTHARTHLVVVAHVHATVKHDVLSPERDKHAAPPNIYAWQPYAAYSGSVHGNSIQHTAYSIQHTAYSGSVRATSVMLNHREPTTTVNTMLRACGKIGDVYTARGTPGGTQGEARGGKHEGEAHHSHTRLAVSGGGHRGPMKRGAGMQATRTLTGAERHYPNRRPLRCLSHGCWSRAEGGAAVLVVVQSNAIHPAVWCSRGAQSACAPTDVRVAAAGRCTRRLTSPSLKPALRIRVDLV